MTIPINNNVYRLGYYPGCALEVSARDYALSLERVLNEAGITLNHIKDWNCCGASAAHSTNHNLSIALPYRNLALAKAQDLNELFAPCPFCSKTLININYELAHDSEHKVGNTLTSITELNYNGSIKVFNSVDIFNRFIGRILPKVNKERLKGMTVACYYGCLLVRPPKILKYDNPEQPTSMDEVVKKIGAEPVDWEFKTECCGGGFTICNEDAVLELSNKILEDAQQNGAKAIIVACQMCHINLDMRQKAIEQKYGIRYQMPIIYLPQLIGLAMGLTPKELGLNLHFVSTNNFIHQVTAVSS